MLQLVNATPFQAERGVFLDLDGSQIWVVAVKATFSINGGALDISDVQESVRLVDEYYDEPGTSSLKYENELVFRKPGTDVVVNGQAYAPRGKRTTTRDVAIRVAGREKVIRVVGDRYWKESGIGLTMTLPQPFEAMPLVYERAFGGTDMVSDHSAEQDAESRNPIGAGFASSRARAKERLLPNLEDPADEITSWTSRPVPIGVGFVGKHWEPRRRFAGTCDSAYIEERLPLYPVDFDTRFFLGASAGLSFANHLRGGEPIELIGLTPGGRLAFALPHVVLGFRTRLNGSWVDSVGKLGTVVIEPDVPRVMLTWHTFLPCHRQTFHLQQTRIFQKRVL